MGRSTAMTGAASAVVEAVDVGKAFGRVGVLRNVTLRVAAGEVVTVFGPNGAGKSTLLRLCATLYRPTSGRLRLFGRDPAHPAVRRRIGVVAHQSFCYPDLTAHENLTFFARAYDLPSPERVAAGWLERIGLGDVGDRPLRVLSRGMEQRLALARALVHDPELLLLDEPWTGLDTRAADVLDALLATAKREGRAVLVVTHDVERGLALADRACILHRGRMVWENDVAESTRAALETVYRRVTAPEAA